MFDLKRVLEKYFGYVETEDMLNEVMIFPMEGLRIEFRPKDSQALVYIYTDPNPGSYGNPREFIDALELMETRRNILLGVNNCFFSRQEMSREVLRLVILATFANHQEIDDFSKKVWACLTPKNILDHLQEICGMFLGQENELTLEEEQKVKNYLARLRTVS
jgi:hypothetical protein